MLVVWNLIISLFIWLFWLIIWIIWFIVWSFWFISEVALIYFWFICWLIFGLFQNNRMTDIWLGRAFQGYNWERKILGCKLWGYLGLPLKLLKPSDATLGVIKLSNDLVRDRGILGCRSNDYIIYAIKQFWFWTTLKARECTAAKRGSASSFAEYDISTLKRFWSHSGVWHTQWCRFRQGSYAFEQHHGNI